MKCTYYTEYPYNRPDMKFKHKPENPKCSYPDFPLRFIKSAVCETDADITPEQFVDVLFEGLDRPDCKGIRHYTEPFEFDGHYYTDHRLNKDVTVHVKVSDNRNLYGATNHDDGIWEINGIYYINSYLKGFRGFPTPKEAIEFLMLHAPLFGYLTYEEVDYELRGDECLKWGATN